MNNQSESNFLIPILSAISGLGAIIAAISPLIFQNYIFAPIFIDSRLTAFASIVAVVVVFITLWLTSSVSSYSLLGNQIDKSKTYLRVVVGFIITSVLFYLMRVTGDSKIIDPSLASFLQLPLYLVSFLFLSIVVGFLFRDSYQSFKHGQLENGRIDKIKDLLMRSGFIKMNLVITGSADYVPQQGEMDRYGSKRLWVNIDDKKYYLLVSREFNQLQYSEEIKSEVLPEVSKKVSRKNSRK